MIKDATPYSILLIEDNGGDRLLITTYLEESILLPKITEACDFSEAIAALEDPNKVYDVILLDLSLPEKKGKELIEAILQKSGHIPVIILTGYSDIEFSRLSAQMGTADYLLKDDLTPSILYKSIIYSIERKKVYTQLEDSEKRYRNLFQLSPIPKWVYDPDTLAFLDVNDAAILQYGYTYDEFMKMTLKDIRPEEDLHLLERDLSYRERKKGVFSSGTIFRHQKKSGDIIFVEIRYSYLEFKGKGAFLVLANDITFRKRYTDTIEKQNIKLKEIAWIQSHIVRAPLARLMGLIHLMESSEEDVELPLSASELNQLILSSANELDQIIREITLKTEQINLDEI